jgi:phosphohistidine phosphatase
MSSKITVCKMKTLLLLRHAKSSWKEPDLIDHDRPLNKRGKQTAPRMGTLMRDEKLIPDLILSSSAMRAYDTARLAAKACSYQGKIEHTGKLYLAEPRAYIEVLQQVDDQYLRVLVVGHNPGLERLITGFTGEAIGMPTGALAFMKLAIKHWRDLETNTECDLVTVWLPRELESAP